MSHSRFPVPRIAYLANQFPSAVEPYVLDEINELRRRGVEVIAGSVRGNAVQEEQTQPGSEREILCLQPLRVGMVLQALWLATLNCRRIRDLLVRVLLRGNESPKRRLKALLHTWLGACYALLLKDCGVEHIHAHHGYFGSWIAMVAARLLGASYSLTLHGSDLLQGSAYLDMKLKHCQFCITISEYNRRFLLEQFPGIAEKKVIVSRLGVDAPACEQDCGRGATREPRALTLLSIGRLHAVKDHAFLIRACMRMRNRGISFHCAIAGEGPERSKLELMIEKNKLQECVTLLGHVRREEMEPLFASADLIVLTSRSEGIPLVLMEAMARGKIVVAPAVTGIPELVIPGKTGFLYAPGVLDDLVAKIFALEQLMYAESGIAVSKLDWVRHAARAQILHNFNGKKNLARFADHFLQFAQKQTSATEVLTLQLLNSDRSQSHEDLVLQ